MFQFVSIIVVNVVVEIRLARTALPVAVGITQMAIVIATRHARAIIWPFAAATLQIRFTIRRHSARVILKAYFNIKPSTCGF